MRLASGSILILLIDYGTLAVENGRGDRIRTCDLFVPKKQSKSSSSGRKHMEAARKSAQNRLQKHPKISTKIRMILRIAEIACPAYAPQGFAELASPSKASGGSGP